MVSTVYLATVLASTANADLDVDLEGATISYTEESRTLIDIRYATAVAPGRELTPGGLSRLLLHPEEWEGLRTIGPDHERVGRIADIFERLDNGNSDVGDPTGGGGDGEVTVAELGHRVHATAKSWHQVADDIWTAAADGDGDGLLTSAEALAADPMSAADSEAAGRRFEAADMNGDGWLAEHEVDRWRNPLWHTGMWRWCTVELWRLLDADHDENVTPTEFRSAYGWTDADAPGVAVPGGGAVDDFPALDSDGDGAISVLEMAGFPEKRLAALLSVPVFEFLASVDDNDDGSLSVQEFERHTEDLTPPFNATAAEAAEAAMHAVDAGEDYYDDAGVEYYDTGRMEAAEGGGEWRDDGDGGDGGDGGDDTNSDPRDEL